MILSRNIRPSHKFHERIPYYCPQSFLDMSQKWKEKQLTFLGTQITEEVVTNIRIFIVAIETFVGSRTHIPWTHTREVILKRTFVFLSATSTYDKYISYFTYNLLEIIFRYFDVSISLGIADMVEYIVLNINLLRVPALISPCTPLPLSFKSCWFRDAIKFNNILSADL